MTTLHFDSVTAKVLVHRYEPDRQAQITSSKEAMQISLASIGYFKYFSAAFIDNNGAPDRAVVRVPVDPTTSPIATARSAAAATLPT